MNFQKTKVTLLNATYFTAVFFAALALTTLSLARRVNTFESTKQPLLISVDKEDIVVANTVSGKIQEIHVQEGQHVAQGDLLISMEDITTEARIESLEEFAADNLSARTEVNLLRAQAEQYEIRAPRDGVVYQILVGGGANVNFNTHLMTLFADDNMRITGLVNPEQYAEIQKSRIVSAYSQRLEQVYDAELEGVGKVFPATAFDTSKYELILRFVNEDEGAAFIEGENLEIISLRQEDAIARPSYVVSQFWNHFIIGE